MKKSKLAERRRASVVVSKMMLTLNRAMMKGYVRRDNIGNIYPEIIVAAAIRAHDARRRGPMSIKRIVKRTRPAAHQREPISEASGRVRSGRQKRRRLCRLRRISAGAQRRGLFPTHDRRHSGRGFFAAGLQVIPRIGIAQGRPVGRVCPHRVFGDALSPWTRHRTPLRSWETQLQRRAKTGASNQCRGVHPQDFAQLFSVAADRDTTVDTGRSCR